MRDQDRESSIGHTSKSTACEHGMPCTSEVNNDGGFKQGHVESCSATTKTVSSIPQCLWPPNLIGW